ncbi:glycine rich domain-containing protein [Clostridioides sp. ZZV14-6105]|uniref:glycine rich domain-containing protein n=1 Tax=Clostridioides sp. ZZV14-6105 TaxID=2811492 RepID=UPI001D10D210|nr:hypothetical protein [Clostridioides sp. ZZV14-6105]
MATVWNFGYNGSPQNVTLKPGKYKFECWGSSGGINNSSWYTDAKGGYSKGEITLKKQTTLYIYVGESGYASSSTNNNTKSGFNGGAKGYLNQQVMGTYYSMYGGGATDIRLVGGAWDNEQSLLSRIIVAGGGGGSYSYTGGAGGGLEGGAGYSANDRHRPGGTQYQGGIGRVNTENGSFGKGGSVKDSFGEGGGGGWFGGAGMNGVGAAGGGSGYILTKNSYKPVGYTPTSEYYFDNIVMTPGGNTSGAYGYALITLLQALPFLTVSSYNSTQATFKADHTDPTLLTKIEYFIDDVLKETITTDLTEEKTINYTLEDNALHTLKIVVTDSANATAEQIVTVSKGIAPLPSGSPSEAVTNQWRKIGEGFKNGKTSIINTLALKNIEASLNNTLVELSEKIKTSFDSSDASVQDLMNQLMQANNTISQLNSKYKYATGTANARENSSLIACIYDPNTSHTVKEANPYWLDLNGIGFIPDIFFAECEYEPHSDAFYKYFVFAIKNTFSISNNTGFVVNIAFDKDYSDKSFNLRGNLYTLGKKHVSMDNTGVRVPALNTLNNLRAYKWHAIKFV